MGFKVVESLTFENTGLSLANVDVTIKASYKVTKGRDAKYYISSTAYMYSGSDHNKHPLDILSVNLDELDAIPVDILTALYTKLKADPQFDGLTLVDN